MTKGKMYKNPAATSSMIVENKGKILLVKRKHEPYQGCWALPGGFLECGKECLEETACRELEEETNLITNINDVQLLRVSSSPTRDPRGHVIDHIYIVRKYSGKPRAKDDAASLSWFPLNNLPALAFDHGDVVQDYRIWRRNVR